MFDKNLKAKLTTISLNGRCRVPQGPVSPDPGRDDDPARSAGEPGASPSGASPSGGGPQPAPDEVPGAGWRERPASTQDRVTEDEVGAALASMPDEDPGLAPGEEPDPGGPPPPARKP